MLQFFDIVFTSRISITCIYFLRYAPLFNWEQQQIFTVKIFYTSDYVCPCNGQTEKDGSHICACVLYLQCMPLTAGFGFFVMYGLLIFLTNLKKKKNDSHNTLPKNVKKHIDSASNPKHLTRHCLLKNI